MVRKLLAIFQTIVGGIAKLKNWIRNPMNGDDPVTPFTRQYLSTGASFAVIIGYRIGEGLFNLLSATIFDSLSYLLNILLGIGSDLWHARPSYSRWALGQVASGLKLVGAVAIAVLMIIIGALR